MTLATKKVIPTFVLVCDEHPDSGMASPVEAIVDEAVARHNQLFHPGQETLS